MPLHRVGFLAGNLINDKGDQSDRLGYHVYAKTLASLLHEVSAPLTVGIFGSWGIGKSYMARNVQDLLKKMERRESSTGKVIHTKSKTKCERNLNIVVMILMFLVLLCTLLGSIVPIVLDNYYREAPSKKSWPNNSSSYLLETTRPMYTLSWSLFGASCFILLITSLTIFTSSSAEGWQKFRRYWAVLLYTMFTEIPLKKASSADGNITGKYSKTIYKLEESNDSDKSENSVPICRGSIQILRTGGPLTSKIKAKCINDKSMQSKSKEWEGVKSKYIFVDFNAWQYVGSDILWAGIILNIVEAIEKEFGTLCVRLFRLFQSDNVSMDEESYEEIVTGGFYLPCNDVNVSEETCRRMLEHFGVVQTMEKDGNRWFIEFDNPIDENAAYRNLEGNGFHVERNRKTSKSTNANNLYRNETYEGDTENQMTHQRNFIRHFFSNPRRVWLGFPYLYCLLLFVISLIVTFIGSVLMMASSFGSNLKAQDEGDLSTGKTVIAVLPPVLVGTYVILKFAWAMFNSQIRRISNAVDGAKGSITAGLGLMNTIKQEVWILSKLINVIRFSHEVDYKVVITIDDLDRCPLEMVKRVLEAVNVLLSDDSSPFICLIVANCRVVAKCIEGGMEEALVEANITGHEYIKKIINLPFCIPSVNCLRRFCEGANDVIDGNTHEFQKRVEDEPDYVAPCDDSEKDRSSVIEGFESLILMEKQRRMIDRFVNFQIKCRELMEGKHGDGELIHKYLISNPRNIKRIFNVLMITLRLLQTTRKRYKFFEFLFSGSQKKTKKATDPRSSDMSFMIDKTVIEFGNGEDDAADLVRWILLTDQWPFLMSCMLYYMQHVQIYEDGYERSKAESVCLIDIYRRVEPNLNKVESRCKLSSLDGNRNLFKTFLEDCLTLDVGRVKTLLRFTVNLDLSLQQEISFYMT